MENETFTFRIPKDLKRRITIAARRDDRTVTSFVIRALKMALRTTSQDVCDCGHPKEDRHVGYPEVLRRLRGLGSTATGKGCTACLDCNELP